MGALSIYGDIFGTGDPQSSDSTVKYERGTVTPSENVDSLSFEVSGMVSPLVIIHAKNQSDIIGKGVRAIYGLFYDLSDGGTLRLSLGTNSSGSSIAGFGFNTALSANGAPYPVVSGDGTVTVHPATTVNGGGYFIAGAEYEWICVENFH